MSDIQSICVYCGSGAGENPAYAKAAQRFGGLLADHDIRLVYGGGGLGLMGTVARAVLDSGGQVLGIIPEFLESREHMLREVQDLIVTQDMHQRKRLMFDNADAFVALPGGIGTLEELIEMLTWGQLGQHNKPVVIANIDGFWDPLLNLLEHMRAQSFIRPGLMATYEVATSPDDILPLIHAEMDRRKGTPVDSGLVDRL
ncbi:MAG: TIGR00730 family Rossman fold protein [Rhodobiaceae bacterium]|nr:TIGR00730 family Rossman fold protein [Rhodobiaceae bacterium]MCB1480109.1 TIGR00730 family Rossman fold protein [Rhodobiaceae bacterium]MCC0053891.1 TIGR00730 family Rossman fold protein [Rhodobiaceae bacterium]